MDEFQVNFPKLVTIAFSRKIVRLCEGAINSPEDTVLFDLSEVEFITPFGVTTLAGSIRNCQRAGKTVRYLQPSDSSKQAYLSRIGFHSYLGLNNEHELSNNTRSVELKQVYSLEPLYTEGLLQVLDSQMNLSTGIRYSINLSLNELMINVFDHSRSPIGAFICAQFTPDSRLIRICIADFGIGILNALRSVEKYHNIRKASTAIRKAVEEGVSSRTKRAKGIGLTHIRNFLKLNQGTLSIISGNSKVNFYYNKTIERKMDVPLNGTIIKLKINSDKESLYFLRGEGKFLFPE